MYLFDNRFNVSLSLQMLTQQRTSTSGTKSFPENLSQVMEHSMMYHGSGPPHQVTANQIRQQNMHSNSVHDTDLGQYPPMQAGHSPYHMQQYPRGVHASHSYPNQSFSAHQVTPGSPYRGTPQAGATVYQMNQYPDPVSSPQYSHLQYSVTGTSYGSPVMNYSVPSPMSPVPHHARAMSPPQVMSPPHAMSPPPFSRVSSPGSVASQQSAAASFFAR